MLQDNFLQKLKIPLSEIATFIFRNDGFHVKYLVRISLQELATHKKGKNGGSGKEKKANGKVEY